MSKLDQLLEKYCSNGVPFYTLGELGEFLSGLSGKTKEDFQNGNSKLITYVNVFNNPAVRLDLDDKVFISENEKQHVLEYGDVIFTGSSETPDECAFSSVVTKKPEEKYYLNSFCFIYRMYDKSLFNPDFLKHLFRSKFLRKQLIKTASGVTRFNVSKKLMLNVKIPVPNMEVQCEIVRILDNFAELTAELTAELSLRKSQAKYYGKLFLNIEKNEKEAKLFRICDIANVSIGEFVKKTEQDNNAKYPVFNGGTSNTGFYNDYNRDENNIIMSARGANAGFVNRVFTKFWSGNSCYTISVNKKEINWTYVYYFLKSHERDFVMNQQKGGIPAVSKKQVENYLIAIPSLERQNNIVTILENFNIIAENFEIGLPAEIKLRKQQYEYYRNKLLTFKAVE